MAETQASLRRNFPGKKETEFYGRLNVSFCVSLSAPDLDFQRLGDGAATPNPLSFEHPPSIAFYPAAAETANEKQPTIIPPPRSDVHQQLFYGGLDQTTSANILKKIREMATLSTGSHST